jgi:hypothetical protein
MGPVTTTSIPADTLVDVVALHSAEAEPVTYKAQRLAKAYRPGAEVRVYGPSYGARPGTWAIPAVLVVSVEVAK